MILILSQLDKVDPQLLSSNAIIALVAIGALVGLVTIWNGVRSRPPHESPTRREFDDLKGKVGHIELSLAPMERRILDGVKEIGHDLTKKIEGLGEHEYTARGELWDKVNRTAERVAAQEGKANLATDIAQAISASNPTKKA